MLCENNVSILILSIHAGCRKKHNSTLMLYNSDKTNFHALLHFGITFWSFVCLTRGHLFIFQTNDNFRLSKTDICSILTYSLIQVVYLFFKCLFRYVKVVGVYSLYPSNLLQVVPNFATTCMTSSATSCEIFTFVALIVCDSNFLSPAIRLFYYLVGEEGQCFEIVSDNNRKSEKNLC